MSVVEDLGNHAATRCHDVLRQTIALVDTPKDRLEISLLVLSSLVGAAGALFIEADGRKAVEMSMAERIAAWLVVVDMLGAVVESGGKLALAAGARS